MKLTRCAALLAAVVLGPFVLVSMPTPASAATPSGIRNVGAVVDRVVPRQLAADKIPGAAVTVVAGGRPVFAKGYGLADVARHVPVRADRTGFSTGSMAKTFTANAVLQLVQAGKIDLDADVNRYLKKFKIADTYPGRPVRVRDLLTHTAGFSDDVLAKSAADPAHAKSLADLAADQPDRVRPPGTVMAYDNYGYTLAGYLVEAVTGEPYDRYVAEHILRPLGMNGTTFADRHPAAIDAGWALGYRPDGAGFTAYRRYYGAAPSGVGPITTAADMGRYMIALLRGDPRIGRGVAAMMRTRQYAQDPRVPGMGFGLEEWPRNGHAMVYKGGDVSGFHEMMALLPGENTGIYVVFNGEGVSGDAAWQAKHVVQAIIDHAFPGKAPAPKPTGGDTSRYAGTYTPARVRGDLLQFGTLFNPATVESTGPGTLHTTGLAADPGHPEQDWTQVGPGLFAERGGPDRIAFDRNGVLAGARNDEASTFVKQDGLASPVVHQAVLYTGLTGFLLAFVAIPIIALVRRLRGRRAQHRTAWWAAWLTSALTLAFAAGLASLFIVDGNRAGDAIFLGSPTLTATLFASSAAFVLTAGLVIYAAVAWIRRWWRLPGRISYTLLTLGSAGFMTVAYLYHMVGGVFG